MKEIKKQIKLLKTRLAYLKDHKQNYKELIKIEKRLKRVKQELELKDGIQILQR